MFGAVLKTAPFSQFYAAGRGGPGLAFETWVFLPTVLGLKRYQDKGHLHFVTLLLSAGSAPGDDDGARSFRGRTGTYASTVNRCLVLRPEVEFLGKSGHPFTRYG